MTIKMTRNSQDSTGRVLLSGKTYKDVSAEDERYLVRIGKAEKLEGKAEQAAPTQQPQAATTPPA